MPLFVNPDPAFWLISGVIPVSLEFERIWGAVHPFDFSSSSD
jgi:hypothetical protein